MVTVNSTTKSVTCAGNKVCEVTEHSFLEIYGVPSCNKENFMEFIG